MKSYGIYVYIIYIGDVATVSISINTYHHGTRLFAFYQTNSNLKFKMPFFSTDPKHLGTPWKTPYPSLSCWVTVFVQWGTKASHLFLHPENYFGTRDNQLFFSAMKGMCFNMVLALSSKHIPKIEPVADRAPLLGTGLLDKRHGKASKWGANFRDGPSSDPKFQHDTIGLLIFWCLHDNFA